MGNFFTPMRMWGLALALFAFDAILVYLFINQPTVLSLQSQWDFRHHDLRRLEQQEERQVEKLIPTTSGLYIDELSKQQQTTPSAEILRPQLPRDSQGKVL